MKKPNEENKDLLAFEYEGKYAEREYYYTDLTQKRDVVELFDYCQILRAHITKAGWTYLIDKFGFDLLFEWNNESGWMDCPDIEEFKSDVAERIND